MKIKIINLQLRNFKGVRDLSVDFDDSTTISGDNGTGKTTVFDAFTWLLFGKNSGDEKDFNIKTLDEHNRPISKLEHEVTGVLDVDGRFIKLRKVYKEKWVKQKGAEVATFTGHETQYFIDDVPLAQNEYKARVDFIINEELAKLITNALYFNQMKWPDRRAVLETIAGKITNEEIAGSNEAFIKLLINLGDSSLIDYKKKIGAKKKLIKDNLDSIPTRIDEVNRSFPDAQDYDSIQSKIESKLKEVATIEEEMENKTEGYNKKFEAIRKQQQELNDLRVELGKAEVTNKSAKANELADIDGKIRTIESMIHNDKMERQMNENTITQNKNKITYINGENDKLRDRWTLENAKELVIDETKFSCPTCKQKLPKKDIDSTREEMASNFNNNKIKVLKQIDEEGLTNKETITKLEANIKILEEKNTTLLAKITADVKNRDALDKRRSDVDNAPLAESKEEKSLKKKIEAFVVPEAPKIDNEELKSRKAVINDEITTLRDVLSGKDQITKLNARKNELQEEERTLSQQLADLEKMEFTIDAFSKAKIETIEARINGKFQLVRFKMFEQQINGGEVECCECMVNGVPYSDINTAGKINAGIDIINALTDHYKMSAPVWIDNRESVIRILSCKSQIINLVAKKGEKLKVSAPESQELA